MKKLIVIFILFSATVAQAEWSSSVKVYKTVASDAESIVRSGSGGQVSLHWETVFLYLSKDVNQVRFTGQGGPDINLWSVGVGMQRTVSKHLTLSLDVGLYEPKFKEMGEPQDYMSSSFAEGLGRYLNSQVSHIGGQGYYDQWEYYTLEYKGAFGGKLSLAFEYPITESISFDMITGYRYLKLLEHITGQDYDDGWARLGESGHWTTKKDRDFSAWFISFAFVIDF